jgi:hypothetical protein
MIAALAFLLFESLLADRMLARVKSRAQNPLEPHPQNA